MSRQPLTPDAQVKIDGKLLSRSLVASLVVLRDVWAPGVFELRLRRPSGAPTPLLAEDALYAVGSPVEIEMGYAEERKPVMTGEITGLELESRAGEEQLTVRGHDRGHRLLRGQKTRSFTQVKDSDIARQVAREAGLSAEVEDTGETLEYVLQHNQTDWELLRQRAWNLGFEVRVQDKTLLFRRHRNNGKEALTLLREGSGLLEFRPRLSTVGLVGQVVVQGWNPKDKETITGRASSRDQKTRMGGDRSGLEIADAEFGSAVGTIVDRPVLSQAEADQIARGRLEEMALAYITGDGLAIGRTDLEAGTVVRINGFGTVFSGLYYLASVRHTYHARRGYFTAFTVRRNAS